MRRVREAEARYNAIESIAEQLHLNERSLPTLFDASMGFRVRNATYRISADVTELVASRDLRLLVERGLLEATGEKRGRSYVRTGPLLEVDRELSAARTVGDQDDPFALASEALRPTFGLLTASATTSTSATRWSGCSDGRWIWSWPGRSGTAICRRPSTPNAGSSMRRDPRVHLLDVLDAAQAIHALAESAR